MEVSMAEKTSYGQKDALTAGNNTNKENLVNEFAEKLTLFSQN